MNWLALLQNLGTFAIASGLLIWAIKTLVSQSLARDIETFKADLKKAHDAEIELLKSDLRIASFRYQTRFARLHETRAEIIAELYKHLVQAEDAIRSLLLRDTGGDLPGLADDKEIEKLQTTTGNRIWELERFFEERRLYFDEELCGMMNLHIGNFGEAWLSGSPTALPNERGKYFEELAGDIRKMRHAIELRMREMLGVDSTNF
jgi:hypothetical protein